MIICRSVRIKEFYESNLRHICRMSLIDLCCYVSAISGQVSIRYNEMRFLKNTRLILSINSKEVELIEINSDEFFELFLPWVDSKNKKLQKIDWRKEGF